MFASVYLVPQALYSKTNAHWLSLLIPLLKVIALPAQLIVWLFRFLSNRSPG